MSQAGRALCLFLSLSSLIACGQIRDDVALEDLDLMVVDAICEVRVRCGQYADKQSCGQAVSTNHQRAASVRDGRAQYDGKAAAACLNAYNSLGCRISDDSYALDALSSCKTMFVGTVGDGGACLHNAECVSQLCNRSSCGGDACCAGTCQTRVKLGGDCSAPGMVCVENAVCVQYASQVPSICVPMTPAGQHCDAAVVCEAGKICNLDPGSEQGTCGDAPSQGAACPSGVCDDSNDYCDASSEICRPRGGVGTVCETSDQCVGFARCDLAKSVCVAKTSLGGACSESANCVRGLSCAEGRCTGRPDAPACGAAS